MADAFVVHGTGRELNFPGSFHSVLLVQCSWGGSPAVAATLAVSSVNDDGLRSFHIMHHDVF